ncbi:MAG: hypothetical protein B1H04_00035 [Planctomycetales bacterium 4484_123]|nr:MAG: hypothetical protein B1H04_00035 [Planctomycetales bacterium 4484_123]
MRRLTWILAGLFAMAIAAPSLLAREGQAAPKKTRKARKARAAKKRPLLRGMHAQMVKVCDLSEDQQKQIAELNAQRAKELTAFREENKAKYEALREALKKAREAKDKEAAKKAWAEYSALRGKKNAIVKKFRDAVMEVLTPEQKAKWDQYQALLDVKRRISPAKLTAEQEEQVKAAYVKLAAGTEATTAKGRSTLLAKLYAQVEKEVLSPEQRTEVAVAYLVRRFHRARLTDEQKAKIKAAYVEQSTGVDMTDRKARMELYNKLYTYVREQILDEQQREKVRPLRQPRKRKPRQRKRKTQAATGPTATTTE